MPEIESTSPVSPGDILAGKYRVEEVLGVGGMGVVVAATHTQLDHRVAVKFLLPAAAQNKDSVERFLREARAAVRLKSEHAVRVIDVGTLESGSPFMVMEYLSGRDLAAELTEQGPLPVDAAVDYVLQACEALAEAHSIGIVHRDIKPQNLFLTRTPGGAARVKVLDFGISKIETLVGQAALTQTMSVMGSPLYMAPEQMRAARLADARSDVWSLGVVMFELLTGRAPFEAESITELCITVVTDPAPTLDSLRDDVPPGLVEIVSRCLEKAPADRFAHAGALAAALEAFAPVERRTFVDLGRASGRTSMVISTPGAFGSQSSGPAGMVATVVAAPPSFVTGPPPPMAAVAEGSTSAGLQVTHAPVAPTRSVTPILVAVGGLLVAAAAAFFFMRSGSQGPARDPLAAPSVAVAHPAAAPTSSVSEARAEPPPPAPPAPPPAAPSASAAPPQVVPKGAPLVKPPAAPPAVKPPPPPKNDDIPSMR